MDAEGPEEESQEDVREARLAGAPTPPAVVIIVVIVVPPPPASGWWAVLGFLLVVTVGASGSVVLNWGR
jgi:hypothetical protein